jgi:hypothetical protein
MVHGRGVDSPSQVSLEQELVFDYEYAFDC